ncbi:glycine cleavage system aminomethyltransferase GcvT [Thermoactinomyces mirandus]|uniref:Aminomethyltransferase n=1 Tax=Thermoactinomyces mirandus TaxID=2756294 RepID=A0A7W1XPL0_9BACL|nr:glycine cleavage system aminomethyltransferase GcvT [Thermoactinomyces mirandus]MBA4600871.1 glycine cleavage system aminomethyltransferase GcvT [Thermoactinomyces mirandus]
MSQLKRTSLYDVYKDEAKMVPFGGWEMPVQFGGIKREHEAVRTKAGLFDVSHMGEILVSGPDALALVQKLTTNDASRLKTGSVQYTVMCLENGGTVDDLLVYRTGEQEYLLVINASNTEKDFNWIKEHATGEVLIRNISDEMAQLALQGPLAESVMQRLTTADLSEIRFFKFRQDVEIAGVKSLVSRTGYTGEDGFEIYFKAEDAPALWKAILAEGESDGVLPCGLGARDTLRFEAALPLYGQELSEMITPVEAGLAFTVKPDKGEFIGREVLARQKQEGASRKLVGLEMIDRGIPRTHCSVYSGEELIGEVTTGTQSPTLKKNIGLALVKTEYAKTGEVVEVEIRRKKLKAKIIRIPFYKRQK